MNTMLSPVTEQTLLTTELDKVDEDAKCLHAIDAMLDSIRGKGVLDLTSTAKCLELVPGVMTGLGIESQLTHDESTLNYELAIEALTNGKKLLIGGMIAALIAFIIKLYKMGNSQASMTGGFGGTRRGSEESFKNGVEEIRTDYTDLSVEIKKMDKLLSEYSHNLNLLDDDVTGLGSSLTKLIKAAGRYSYISNYTYDPKTDGPKVGHILYEVSGSLTVANLSHYKAPNFSWFYEKEEDLSRMYIQLDKFVIFIDRHKWVTDVLPDAMEALSKINYACEAHRGMDIGNLAPGDNYHPYEIMHDIIDNKMGINELASQYDIDQSKPTIEKFKEVTNIINDIVSHFFRPDTNIYSDTDEMDEYIHFILTGKQTGKTKIIDHLREIADLTSLLTGVHGDSKGNQKTILKFLEEIEKYLTLYNENAHTFYHQNEVEGFEQNKRKQEYEWATNIKYFVTKFSIMLRSITVLATLGERMDNYLQVLKEDQEKTLAAVMEINAKLEKVKK